tara:strand:+ start:230 stop:1930 length:1701 start_codon:yes stop_codon:yes gene_type:complete
MSILRTDKIAGLESVNAITGSVKFGNGVAATAYDSLVTDASSDYTMGTGDFNLEGWFYLNTVTTTWQILISDTLYGDTGGWSFYANGAQLNFWKGGASVVSGGTLTANTWHHIAFSREGGTNRIFVDGVVAGTATDSTDYTDNRISVGANNVDKGGVLGSYGLSGYASNVRVCKGHAVYKGAFTPPTRELLRHYTSPGNESVLLCCQSSQDAGQDATGRTLSVRGNAEPSTFVPDVGNDHTHGTVLEGSVTFDSLNYMTLPRGTTTQSNRGRGTFSGGYTPSPTNTNLASIDYVQIQSLGNSIDFGDLTEGRYGGGSGASSTRGLQIGGRVSSTKVNTIDYITFATTSNAIDFGDLLAINAYVHGASSNTRALNMGGATPAVTDTIEYVTIASTGNGTDFGNLTDARGGAPAVASPTRACCMGGYDGSSWINIIDYVTIATTGNATDFGDLSSAFGYGGGLSSNTRGIMGGGARGSGEINDIVYITIASTGNATDFGDLYAAREHTSATSNSIRGIWGGGVTPTYYNNIQYVTISTTGNASDFGDFIVDNSKAYSMSTSDSHGGLV